MENSPIVGKKKNPSKHDIIKYTISYGNFGVTDIRNKIFFFFFFCKSFTIQGVPLNLDEDEFTVHECAAVLKNFLANLPGISYYSYNIYSGGMYPYSLFWDPVGSGSRNRPE